MTAQDIITVFRTLTGERYQTRWVDVPSTLSAPIYNSTLILADLAQREVARETRWLKGRQLMQTQPNIGEYKITFQRVSILRAYILTASGPQRLAPTTMSQMTGDQLRLYDQSAKNYTPQWQAIPPEPYPVANGSFGVGFFALPMMPGRRPQYYIEGDMLGIVPVPSASYGIYLDTKAMPQKLVAVDQNSEFPDDWVESIGQKMVALAYQADQDDAGEAKADTRFKEALAKTIWWAQNDNEEDPEGPQILTHRSFYSGGVFGGGGS